MPHGKARFVFERQGKACHAMEREGKKRNGMEFLAWKGKACLGKDR
jgi:hypothetical protein